MDTLAETLKAHHLDQQATAEQLTALAEHPDPAVRQWLASHPNTEAAVLRKLTRDFETAKNSRCEAAIRREAPILTAVLGNKNTPLDIKLYYPESTAEHPNSNAALLRTLVKKRGDKEVCYEVASHPNLTPALAKELAKSPWAWVRGALATNPRTPLALVEALAEDQDSDVPIAIAKNPNTPLVLLKKLKHHHDGYVSRAACDTLGRMNDGRGAW
jgi:hypothetical protein